MNDKRLADNPQQAAQYIASLPPAERMALLRRLVQNIRRTEEYRKGGTGNG